MLRYAAELLRRVVLIAEVPTNENIPKSLVSPLIKHGVDIIRL